MNTNHSPLPWHLGIKPGPIVYGPSGEQVASLHVAMVPVEENKANADYIVRACNAFPALVEALEACEKAMGKHPAFNVSNARLEARAALALARGENGYERKLTELTEKLRVFEKGESK